MEAERREAIDAARARVPDEVAAQRACRITPTKEQDGEGIDW